MQTHFSTTGVAELLAVEPWRIRRLFELNVLPEPPYVGRTRAIPREMLPAIIDALRDRGWLPNPECPVSGEAVSEDL